MYYYIMEGTGKKGAAWYEKVKNILGNLGIAGETVTPSPARTVEELASLGIVKGYSTIVAVGSEKIVNTIVNTMINQTENKDVVLGIIPEDYDSVLAKKIRVKSLEDACNALKMRKLETTDACFIEPNKYFLTEAEISSSKPIDAYLITPQIKAGVVLNHLFIRPGLEIEVLDSSGTSSPGSFLNRLFGKKETTNGRSYFRTKQIKIDAPDGGVPVKVENEVIAKTPIVAHNRSKALKIIVARDIIKMKE